MIKRKFDVGDVVRDGNFIMKVVSIIKSDDNYYYECKPADFEAPFTREIPQEFLRPVHNDEKQLYKKMMDIHIKESCETDEYQLDIEIYEYEYKYVLSDFRSYKITPSTTVAELLSKISNEVYGEF